MIINNNYIKRIYLENYKSIKKVDIELTNLNVLIGANGAGKSNFIGFFAFLQNMIKENLRGYVGKKGGQDAFLCYGRKESDYLSAKIEFIDEFMRVDYKIKLNATNENVFKFDYEELDSELQSDENLNNKGYESKLIGVSSYGEWFRFNRFRSPTYNGWNC